MSGTLPDIFLWSRGDKIKEEKGREEKKRKEKKREEKRKVILLWIEDKPR